MKGIERESRAGMCQANTGGKDRGTSLFEME